MTSETKKNDTSGTDLPPEDDALARAVRQERINAEILKAVEMLGDRLARSEARRSELETQVKKLESRPRALINLPVVRRAAPPALIRQSDKSASQPMSLGRLALVAGVSAFIVTAGFGLGVIYGQQNGSGPAGAQLAALDRDAVETLPDTRPGQAALADLVANTGAPGRPVPFSSTAAREDGIQSFAPDLSITRPQVREQTVIRMGEPKPVTPEDTATAAAAPEPAQTESRSAESLPAESLPAESLPEVEVAAVRATPPQDAAPDVTPAAEATAARQPEPVETARSTAVDLSKLTAEKFPRPGRDGNLPDKVKKIEQGAFDGLGEAQHDLATFYVSGQDGVEVDFIRAAYWFQQSAAAGVANAAYNLGVMYQQGLGVGPDVNMALKWYMEAAQLGHPEAQYNLGVAYAEGQGLEPNMQRAVSFFEQASDQGVSPAAFNLGLIYENGLLGRPDENKAAEWYKQAALMGHDEARAAWERMTGEDFDAMIASVNEGAARAASAVAPAAGSRRRGPQVADINVMDQEAHHTMVRQVQEELIKLQLIPGPADGMETPILRDAISAYERKNGLEITGKPTRDLLRRLRQ